MNRLLSIVVTVALTGLATGCVQPDGAGEPQPATASGDSRTTELTDEQLRNGIGPIRSLDLTGLNSALAEQGEGSYTRKCASCHQWEERLIGPPLHDVLERRTPEFIMNMMLKPEDMEKRHPDVRRLREEYGVPMPNQFISSDEARAILEYIRQRSAG